MLHKIKGKQTDLFLVGSVVFLVIFSILALNSIAPYLFPTYYLYILAGILAFVVFSRIDFDVLELFSRHFFVTSIIFLGLPLLVGQVTRGAVRWLQFGALTIQPAEIVRPFLIIYFANYMLSKKLDFKRFVKGMALALLPVLLIMIQPSLGVSVLVGVSYVGVLLATSINKKYLFGSLIFLIAVLPLFWLVMAPYQKQRVTSFLEGSNDPLGAGYNSIQSVISIGAGKITGKGLGKGVQTQLAFLPEKHTDFIFASIAEEMGMIGVMSVMIAIMILFFRIVAIMENSASPVARAFIMGAFLSLSFQAFVNMGMNTGLVPITGLPLPLVSAGGSSFLGTMIALGMIVASEKRI